MTNFWKLDFPVLHKTIHTSVEVPPVACCLLCKGSVFLTKIDVYNGSVFNASFMDYSDFGGEPHYLDGQFCLSCGEGLLSCFDAHFITRGEVESFLEEALKTIDY